MAGFGAKGLGVALPPAVPIVDYLQGFGIDPGRCLAEGFQYLRRGEDRHALALEAASSALRSAHLDPGAVDAVVTYSGALTQGYRPVGSFLVHSLDLRRDVVVIGMQMQGCTTLFSALRAAHALARTEDLRNILIVSVDVHEYQLIHLHDLTALVREPAPPDVAGRLLNNRFESAWPVPCSDGACAVVVGPDSPHRHFLGMEQGLQASLWSNRAASPGEGLESSLKLPLLLRRTVMQLQAETGIACPQVERFFTNNIGRTGIGSLAQLLGVQPERFYTETTARIGHIVTCDPVVNWWDHEQRYNPGRSVMVLGAGVGGYAGALLVGP